MKTCKFSVTGMTCAACQANVTKAASKLSGTEKADVNLLSGTLTVTFYETKLTEQDYINAVNNIGYGASLYGENEKSQLKTVWQERKKKEGENINAMKKRLISSIILNLELNYISNYFFRNGFK